MKPAFGLQGTSTIDSSPTFGGVAVIAAVGPALGVAAARREAGVDAGLDLRPLLVVDDVGAEIDALGLVVELDRLQQPGGDLGIMLAADVAEALAAAGLVHASDHSWKAAWRSA
jgi:hypothetical protein